MSQADNPWLNSTTRTPHTINGYTPEEQAWDHLVEDTAAVPHFMQGSAWGEAKAGKQWALSRYTATVDNAPFPMQVFSRLAPGLGTVYFAPELVRVTPSAIAELTGQLKTAFKGGLVFKFETYQPYSEELIEAFKANGWKPGRSVQHRHTVIINLDRTEDELFASFKKRARYEARVGERSGVVVKKVEPTQENLDKMMSLIDVTAERTGAFFRSAEYSNKYWHSFAAAEQGDLYFATHEGDLLAAAFVLKFGKSAWYKDGGSTRNKSNLMAPRLLQWEIMKDLQRQGIKYYDLSGVPAPEDVETSHMKGLYVFKTAFTHDTTRLMPVFELPLSPRHSVWPKYEKQYLRLYSGIKKDFWY